MSHSPDLSAPTPRPVTESTGPGLDTMSAFDMDRPRVLDRREGPWGEVVLRQHGELLQIIANGCFLMDTSNGRSERLLVRSALAEWERHNGTRPQDSAPPHAPSLLIGGLGVGFSLNEAVREPRWSRVIVVERERAIIDWHHEGPLAPLTAEALADPRTELVRADLLDYLAPPPDAAQPSATEDVDVLCLDIDNGPDWTVTEDNGSLYSPAGLASCAARLRPSGVLAVWSAAPSEAFEDALRHSGFVGVRTEAVPVVRGVPDVVHFAVKPT